MIKIICVGKLKEKALQALVHEYLKRLQGYTKIEILEVNDEVASEKNSELENKRVRKIEGERILKKVKDKAFLILLDLHGSMLSSEQLATKTADIQTYHTSDIVFVIGGSLGVSEGVINRSDMRWQLSSLTFPHQIVRLLVLEQIYRSYKINNNETYHK